MTMDKSLRDRFAKALGAEPIKVVGTGLEGMFNGLMTYMSRRRLYMSGGAASSGGQHEEARTKKDEDVGGGG
jgi:DhnA family fructose-bisphosphate aldolase class Ia